MKRIIEELTFLVNNTRVFLSMPYLEGVSPRILREDGRTGTYPTGEPLERRHGIFCADEVGLSVFDHGALYGDSVFEGILVTEGRIFTWKEHLERLEAGSRRLRIDLPYDPVDLSLEVMRTIREAGCGDRRRGYLRLVVTRGLGDLGIHPKKCLGSTVFAIAASLQLYPEELYERGIGLSVARQTRRPGAEILDPTVKSSNYLNNILALVESLDEGRLETLMLNQQGFVAEATADNLFLVRREEGWRRDPARVKILTPASDYCLAGITRRLILDAAKKRGYRCEEASTMLPTDLVGDEREVFLTGTGAGLVPVVAVADHVVGDGRPGPITLELRQELLSAIADPQRGLTVTATRAEVERYLTS